jgi:dTDP-4-dehydrorhamnose reductase
MIQRILYTGNQGFFGRRFERFYGTRYTIRGIDQHDVDILDTEALNELADSFQPDLVIHGAGITSTTFSNENPELTHRVNVEGARNVGQAAARADASMIFLSTEQVFNGNTEPGPYAEDHPAHPNTRYGETKLEAEGILSEIVEKLWILRFTWLFGLPERGMPANPNVMWNTVQAALSGRRTPVATREHRGLTYVYEMVEQFSRVFEIPYGTYHIGSRNDLSRYDFSCHILREMGLEHRIDELLEPDHEKHGDRGRDIRLDTSKIAGHGILFRRGTDGAVWCLKDFGMHQLFGQS